MQQCLQPDVWNFKTGFYQAPSPARRQWKVHFHLWTPAPLNQGIGRFSQIPSLHTWLQSATAVYRFVLIDNFNSFLNRPSFILEMAYILVDWVHTSYQIIYFILHCLVCSIGMTVFLLVSSSRVTSSLLCRHHPIQTLSHHHSGIPCKWSAKILLVHALHPEHTPVRIWERHSTVTAATFVLNDIITAL